MKLRDKVHLACNKAAIRFEHKHEHTIHNFDFKRGDLVLIYNIAIEKVLNRKIRPQYFGPMLVISRNCSGAYIICNMNGTLMYTPVVAFWVIPYFAQKHIKLLDIEQHIDVSAT